VGGRVQCDLCGKDCEGRGDCEWAESVRLAVLGIEVPRSKQMSVYPRRAA
jgi:hypothetical protein